MEIKKQICREIQKNLYGYILNNKITASEISAIFAYYIHLKHDKIPETQYTYSKSFIISKMRKYGHRQVYRACDSLQVRGIFFFQELENGNRICNVKFPDSEYHSMSNEYMDMLAKFVVSLKLHFSEICILLAFWEYRKWQEKHKFCSLKTLFENIHSCSEVTKYRAFKSLFDKDVLFYEENELRNAILRVDLNIWKEKLNVT